MLTFIIGRAFRSFLVIFIAALLLHTIVLIYLPDKLQADYSAYFGDTGDNTAQGPRPQWPAEFFLWLFHTRTDAQDPNDQYGIGMGATPITEIKFGDVDIKGSGALTGDFGISTIVGKGIPARDVIASRWGNTLALVITALIPTILIGVPLGVFAASRKGSTVDNTVALGSFLGLSMPPFWLGLVLVLFLAVVAKSLHDNSGWTWLPYLPPGNDVTAGEENNIPSRLYHLVLPASTLAISEIAILSRHVRSAMLDVLNEDYIRTAWAKGLSRTRVLFRHAFRNAIIPVITTIALTIPTLVAGTIVIETVFQYPGIGQLFFQAMGGSVRVVLVQAAGQIDFNIVLVLMIAMVIVVVLSSLVADMLYAVFSPRMARR